MYIVIGKIVVGALFYVLVTGLLGLILNACLESDYISDINFFYFWIIGIFLFALIYEVNY